VHGEALAIETWSDDYESQAQQTSKGQVDLSDLKGKLTEFDVPETRRRTCHNSCVTRVLLLLMDSSLELDRERDQERSVASPGLADWQIPLIPFRLKFAEPPLGLIGGCGLVDAL
jgi:hypothetical protein